MNDQKEREATEYIELNQVQDDLKAFEARLGSMMTKNDELQDKISVVNKEQMTLVIPKSFIKEAIAEQISKMSDDLINKVEVAEEALQELALEENVEALNKLTNLGDIQRKIDNIEYDLDEKASASYVDDEINSEINSRLYEYKDEYEIQEMIDDSLCNNDVKTDIRTLDRQVKELEERMDSKNGFIAKIMSWFKALHNPTKNTEGRKTPARKTPAVKR